jgi:hypothetical protein
LLICTQTAGKLFIIALMPYSPLKLPPIGNLINLLCGLITDTIAAISHHDDLEKEWEDNQLTEAGAPKDFTLEKQKPSVDNQKILPTLLRNRNDYNKFGSKN